MESIITLVTASMATGINATITRQARLEATTLGAAFHTIRNRGGMFRKALSRSLHVEGALGSFSVGAVPMPTGFGSEGLIAYTTKLRPRWSCYFLWGCHVVLQATGFKRNPKLGDLESDWAEILCAYFVNPLWMHGTSSAILRLL
jgi:hypothetical protein